MDAGRFRRMAERAGLMTDAEIRAAIEEQRRKIGRHRTTFSRFKDARVHALSLSGGDRLTRTKEREWLGNGFGHSSAEYEARDTEGNTVAKVYEIGIGWAVWEENPS